MQRPRWLRIAIMIFMPVCLLIPAAVQVRSQAPTSESLVIKGGTIIDVRNGTLHPDSVVVIQGNHITQVGKLGDVTIPEGAKVIHAEGKYIMPGLWDSHAHTRDFDGIFEINHGVTSTMDMGNVLDWIIVMKQLREKGVTFGPRIFPDGMVIGGHLGPHEWAASNPEQARWAAQQNIAAGVSFLKVYQEATPDMVRAVAEEAHKAGLNLTGHLRRTDAREAVLAGINALAHGSGIAAATSPPDVAKRIKDGELGHELGYNAVVANYLQDRSMFPSLVKLMVAHNIRLETNFVVMFKGVYPESKRFVAEAVNLAMQPNVHVPPTFYRAWASHFPFRTPASPELMKKEREGYANAQLFAREYAAAGGKFFAGTDAWYLMAPGLALWQELQLMSDAGIPNLDILQACTINPAEFVHQDKNLGTVEAGKLADIIILGRNPLENVRNIRSLETVIQHGKIQRLGYWPEYRNPVPRPYQMVPGQFPRPYISSIQPSVVPMGTKNLVLTIKGTHFDAENRVLWEDADLHVLKATPTEEQVEVPPELLCRIGTYKVHMITGGREPKPSWNYDEVIVSLGVKFNQRWDGQTMSIEFPMDKW
jgi:imidazolonepropionase-like amidohydrolase